MHSDRDIQILTNIRKYLIDVSRRVYRDYKFFFQADNKNQRREIYNHDIVIDDHSFKYPVVCKSCCEMIKNKLVSLYGYDVSVISCDNDEFGHCDILVKGDKKYIINCLSDLELNQVGMMSRRFASYEYYMERYPSFLDDPLISFLTPDEVKQIDSSIGFFDGIYFDDVIEQLAKEFKNFSYYLETDDGLREILLGKVDSSVVSSLSILDMLKVKFKFLCNYFNGRESIIGHIELVRIYKILLKKFFSSDELKYIKWSNCFFDRENCNVLSPVFNTFLDRIRFISFEIDDMVYLISVVSNEFLYMSSDEWSKFKIEEKVITNSISRSNDTISEHLRNKGIGVNIMKHSVVKKLLYDIEDCILYGKSRDERNKILEDVNNQGNNVVLTDNYGDKYCIFLDDKFIKITINDDSYIYYYVDDNLVLSNYDENVTYKWKDEGKYEQYVFRKNNFRP